MKDSHKSAFPLQQPHSSLTSHRQDGFHLSQPFSPSPLRRSKIPTVGAKSPDSTSTAKPTPPASAKPKLTTSMPDKSTASATHNPNAMLHPPLLRREHAESRSRSRRQCECHFSVGASPGKGNGYPEGHSSFQAAAVATSVLAIGTSVTASEMSAIAMDMFSDSESTTENDRHIRDGSGHVSDSDSEVLLAS